MQSRELTNLLELIRECRAVLASGRIADGAHMARLAEAEQAELMGLDAAPVDKRHRPPAYGPRGYPRLHRLQRPVQENAGQTPPDWPEDSRY